MATPFDQIGGLLGMDPEQLKSLMAQFAPGEDERKAAKMTGLTQLGLGLLGARKGREWDQAGYAGQNALAARDASLAGSQAAKMQQFQMVEHFSKLKAQMAEQQRKQAYVNTLTGGGSAPAPQDPSLPQMRGPSLGVTPNAPPQQSGGTRAYLLSIGVPEPEIVAATMSADPPAAVSKLIQHYTKPEFGAGKVPMVRTADGFKAVVPQGFTEALSAQTTAEEEAKAAAAAKYDVIKVDMPDGSTRQVPRAEYLKSRQGPALTNFTPDFHPTPTQIAAIRQDYPNYQPPTSAGMGASMPPLVAEQAKANINTAAGAAASANTDFITNSYRPVMTAAAGAKNSNVSLDQIEKLPITDKTGWGAGTQLYAAKVLTGLGVAPEKVKEYATQGDMFNRAVMTRNWEVLNQAKGMQTEGDSQRALKTDQSLQGTPEYNQWVRDITRATNNLHIRQAEFYAKHYGQAQKAGSLSQLETEWAQKAPSLWDDPVMKKWQEYGAKAAPAAITPEQAQAELRRRGIK